MSMAARFPRWSIEVIRTVVILAIVLAVGTVYTARGDHHDVTYYACVYAGSLSQVGTTQPANCGRGTLIEWTSFGGTIDEAQLSEELQDALRCGEFPHWEVDWSGCDVRGANLSNVRLRSANLSDANVSHALFFSADLTFADLIGAFAVEANFTDAVLFGADLTGANMRATALVNANFTNADLTNVDLTNANITGWNVAGATFCNTTMPDGTVNNADC